MNKFDSRKRCRFQSLRKRAKFGPRRAPEFVTYTRGGRYCWTFQKGNPWPWGWMMSSDNIIGPTRRNKDQQFFKVPEVVEEYGDGGDEPYFTTLVPHNFGYFESKETPDNALIWPS